MKYLILLMMVAACGHSTGKLSDAGKHVKVLDSKPAKCDVVGKVMGLNKKGSVDLARNEARNQAAKLGGTAIFIEQEIPNGKGRAVHATAYACQD
jgi:hypothetical protein